MSRTAGYWTWRACQGQVEVCFGGKGATLEGETLLRHVLPAGIAHAWLRQVHSTAVLEARAGDNGPGDALVTERRKLALAVVTADCVPVLLASDRAIAAVHAGWRGLAQSILPAACQRLRVSPATMTAWIGPAIGPCCYEVGTDVALKVSAASSEAVVRYGPRGRPHLDLVAAASIQLRRFGDVTIHAVDACTRCDDAYLWSYRREGPAAGRNVAAIWRS